MSPIDFDSGHDVILNSPSSVMDFLCPLNIIDIDVDLATESNCSPKLIVILVVRLPTVNLFGVANIYDAGGLCRLWYRAQGEK